MNLIIVLGLFCSGLWLFELFLFCLICIWMYCCCCCLLFLNRSFTRTPAATCALYTPYRFSSIQGKVQTTMLSIPPKRTTTSYLKSLRTKRITLYGIGITCPALEQAQRCGRVKHIIFSDRTLFTVAIHIKYLGSF